MGGLPAQQKVLGNRPLPQSLNVPSRMQLRILAGPEARVNLIPVDMAVKRMTEIARHGSAGSVFHITNPEQPTVRECLRVVFDEVGLPEPVYVSDKGDSTTSTRSSTKRSIFCGSYLRGTKLFSRANAGAASPAQEPGYRMDEAAVRAYAAWYGEVLRAPAQCCGSIRRY